uniref:Putative secreted protein n=1 Tax=Ixodes ricinus TaxID=34613 RepID=A0A6B0U855_IXORI
MAALLGHQIQFFVLAQRVSSVLVNIRAAVLRSTVNRTPKHENGTLCLSLIKNSKSRFSAESSFCRLGTSGSRLNRRANNEKEVALRLSSLASSSRTDL